MFMNSIFAKKSSSFGVPKVRGSTALRVCSKSYVLHEYISGIESIGAIKKTYKFYN